MAGGSYRGGSTIIHTGSSTKVGLPRTVKKGKRKVAEAPGLHVLSKEDSKAVMKKVWSSRRRSQSIAAEKAADAANFKLEDWRKFVADVKKSVSK